VFQRRVVVEYDKTNRYGRLVSKVLLNGQDECLDRQAYAAAETEARAARRGLWRDGEPVPPWEWRHR
jgi:endonuclease YncB( thermonuclease family)